MEEIIKKYIVTEDITILEAMKVINSGGKGSAYVCKENILLASITDGDIRRAILKGKDVNEKVIEIANFKPYFLLEKQKKKSKVFMKEHSITSVPIVKDNNMELCDIVFMYDTRLNVDHLGIPVYIMAGGKGTRLKPYTDILPKPLIPIGEKTITEHIMDRFSSYGCNEYHMIVNYKKGLIKAYFAECEVKRNVHFIDEDEFLGTGGGLKLIDPPIKDTVFVTNCDILIEGNYKEIYDYHKKSKNIITMVCVNKTEVIPYGTIELDECSMVKNIKEKPSYSFNTNTGLYMIEPEFIDMIPPNEFVHITDTIAKCIQLEKRVGAYFVSEDEWLDMGQLEKLRNMEEKLGL